MLSLPEMGEYEVIATAEDGTDWCYTVTGPTGQKDQAVCEAYRKHGEARQIDHSIPRLTPYYVVWECL